MSRILREYPPEPYVASARYALAQQVYAKGDALVDDAALRAKFRKQAITRIDLVQQALKMLESFVTSYPEDPAADEAAFSLASALLELKQYQTAMEASQQYAQRYPESSFVESYWYTAGFCQFALGQHDAALATCRKVAQMKRKDQQTGQVVEAENRWQAVYILGQIHHSLGQAAEAIREYARVKDRYPDAAQAIAYFTRKEIRLPEVTTLRPDEMKQVELSFRNIASCDIRVYKIDLMKFSLLNRNLKNITQINLAGIRPYHTAAIPLGDGKDYRDRKHLLEMPLAEEGAYLVVCRGANMHTSGLVLVSSLIVDVQEDRESGRVRTTVKEVSNAEGLAQYLADVHVKVIGSNNDAFTAGATDLRGVYVADSIAGTSTVIAEASGGKYAFFRGTTNLGHQENAAPSSQESRPTSGKETKTSGKKELLKNVYGGRKEASQGNYIKLQKLYQNKAKGVQVQQAK